MMMMTYSAVQRLPRDHVEQLSKMAQRATERTLS